MQQNCRANFYKAVSLWGEAQRVEGVAFKSTLASRARGGHGVPTDKIEARYHRSNGLLTDAIKHANRACPFDNSGHNKARVWLAEITDGRTIEIKASEIPEWFSAAVLREARPVTPNDQ